MINKLIEKRYSPRAFSNKRVNTENLIELFQAASYAASSRNEQPWRFIYVTKEQPEEYHNIFECLGDWNQKWAKLVPVLIVTVAKIHYDHKNYPNSHAKYDLGQAVGTMAIQVTELGLHMHQMGGFDSVKAKNDLNIPEGYEAVSMIALGYLGEQNDLDEEFLKIESNERIRKPVSEIAFKGEWREESNK